MFEQQIQKVLIALKDVIPYKEDIVWGTFKSIVILGKYKIKDNMILINEYLDNEQTILNVIAHELIHACGVRKHGKEFKHYMNKINSLNLGFTVCTNGNKEQLKKFRNIQQQKRSQRKQSQEYIVWCPICGWNRIYSFKHHKLNEYSCPKCRHNLRQKMYKNGVTIQFRGCL